MFSGDAYTGLGLGRCLCTMTVQPNQLQACRVEVTQGAAIPFPHHPSPLFTLFTLFPRARFLGSPGQQPSAIGASQAVDRRQAWADLKLESKHGHGKSVKSGVAS